jgi:hypothetical protein
VTTKRPSEAPQEKAADSSHQQSVEAVAKEPTGTEAKGHCCHD